MIIAATSDIHLPKNYNEFLRAFDRLNVKPDLFLLAGDMVHRGDVYEYEKVHNLLFGKVFCPIVACFGNNEFQEFRDLVKRKFREIKFLDDQSIELKTGNETVGIFGTTGSLETLTPWQRAHMPQLEKTYRLRIELADKHLQRMNTKIKILLMHYAPTYKTLEGENPRFYSSMGNQLFENVINARKPTLVVHGHSHRGTKLAWVDAVPVFNVNFSVNNEIVVIDTEKIKPGLAKFV